MLWTLRILFFFSFVCNSLPAWTVGLPEASVQTSHLCCVPSTVHDWLIALTLKWRLLQLWVLLWMGKLECDHRGTALIHCFHSRGSQWAHQCNGQWVIRQGICSFKEEKPFLWGFCGVLGLLFAGDYPMSPSR